MTTLEDVLVALKSSPLFQLSLGSKELFHSNFIGWVTDRHREVARDVWARFVPEVGPKITGIHRERRHHDLEIEFEPGGKVGKLIIELKVKSLPSRGQLKEYAETLDGASDAMVLMSFAAPRFFGEGGEVLLDGAKGSQVRCRWVDLSEFAACLCAEVGKVAPRDADGAYFGALLNDYASFASSLKALTAVVRIDWDLAGSAPFFFCEDERGILERGRLHDLAYKFRYDQVCSRLQEKFLEMSHVARICNWQEGNPSEFVVNAGMTHGMGLVSLGYMLPRTASGGHVVIGVQLQARAYRLFLEAVGVPEAPLLNMCEALDAERLWFDFEPLECDLEAPKVRKGGADGEDGRKRYNKFGTPFRYLSRTMKGSVSSDAVVAHMLRDVLSVKEREREIVEAVGETLGLR